MKKQPTPTTPKNKESLEITSEIASLENELADEQQKIAELEIALAAMLTPAEERGEEEPSYEEVVTRQENLTRSVVKARMRAEYLERKIREKQEELGFVRVMIEIPHEKERKLSELLIQVKTIREALASFAQIFEKRKELEESFYDLTDEQNYYTTRYSSIVTPTVELEKGKNSVDGPYALDYRAIECSVREILLKTDPLTVDRTKFQQKLRDWQEQQRQEARKIEKSLEKRVPVPSAFYPA